MIVTVPKGRTLARTVDDSGIVILVVGNLRQWQLEGRSLPELPDFHFVGFDELDRDMLADIAPDVVLSTLMAADFDAVDVARCLSALGFKGRYRALTNVLPNPDAVRAEVQAAAAGLDFDLLVLDPNRSNGPH